VGKQSLFAVKTNTQQMTGFLFFNEEREVSGSERHYGWGEQFIIGFEGVQALPVCPSGKCKLLTGTIAV
jgi:hypothetical protein